MSNLGRILMVEDDSKDVELSLSALEDYNLANEVVVVRDGEEALDYLYCRGKYATRPNDNPAVLLLDLKLPKVDGLEVLQQVKSDERLKMIPVVVLTSSREEKDMVASYRLGVNAYVVKPVDFHEFVNAIKELGIFWAVVNVTASRELKKNWREMKPRLRILFLEDDPRDVELIRETLEADDIVCDAVRVDTEAGFIASLEAGGFDLILADYTLPSFDGISALKIVRQGWPEVPFIFVSGTLGEEVAIEALKIGATDYVFKTRLARIVPSVQRALREAAERNELSRAEEALRRSEAYLAEAQRLSHTGSFGWDVSVGEIYWSLETFRIFECEPADRVPLDLVVQRTHPEDRQRVQELMERVSRDGSTFDFEHRLLVPDGRVKYVRVVGHPSSEKPGGFELVGAVTDISERRRAEAELKKALNEIKKLQDQLYKENIALREEIDKASMFEEIVGDSPALHFVLSRVAKVAPTDSTVLITGETGTGKELIARAIHKRSRRASRAFVSVNCAATPTALIASELFGHEKGAFTGALQRRLGRFELAEGGTIFLDEVGELPPETQVALLRVLQEREFERVGGSQSIRADVRVITATNRDLESAIAEGTFRNDLFYRLNVFPIEIPPLRERTEDIPTLIEYFIHRYSRKAGKKVTSIEKRTLEMLQSYAWPGNIRELQNVIERSIIVCETDLFSVDPSWLSLEGSPCRDSEPVVRKSVEQERAAIEVALAASGGRVSGPAGAAAQLNMPASTLESKIRSLKINKFRFKNV